MSKKQIEESERFVKELLMKFEESTSSLLNDKVLEETEISEECTEDVNTTSYLSDDEAAEMFLEMTTIHKDDAAQECKATEVGASYGSFDSSTAPGKSKYEKIRDDI